MKSGINGDVKMDTEFVPTPETDGKPFQVDKYGNHRIVMKGVKSDWYKPKELATLEVVNKNGNMDIFISATFMHPGPLPTECVLRAVVVDEDGDDGYYKFKFVDLVTDKVLDAGNVLSVIKECTRGQDYGVSVRASGRVDFVKIKVIAFDAYGQEYMIRQLNRDDVLDFLRRTLDPYEFDIYDEENEVINLPIEK